MLLEIDHHSGVPIYRQIIEQIRRQIVGGLIAAGEQLMSVRELAGKLKVNPMTVSKAYAYLEMEKLVERRRGVGLFVAVVSADQKQQTGKELVERQLGKAIANARLFGMGRAEIKEIIDEMYLDNAIIRGAIK
ncbi:MAG: GntR family transcriptional regulator [Sedimentisphaerales bacterium]|nr:GntR family transcriptional regulator [Sedimentisphaerales bacterium]